MAHKFVRNIAEYSQLLAEQGKLKIKPKKMVDLNITNCNKCGKEYLVGIDGKDIRKSKTSGGKMGDIPFMVLEMRKLKKHQN